MQFDISSSAFPFSITPSDTVDLAVKPKAITIAVGGAVKFTRLDGTTDTITLPAGVWPAQISRLWATGTTATGFGGL